MKDTRFLKFVLFINGAVPVTLLAWDAWHGQLGANPVNFAILTTGMLALIFISLTLLVTPLRRITGWNWLIFSRRTLGLYAFFYASVHFGIFFLGDRGGSVSSTIHEILHRNYLIFGSLALLLMVPLAITSTGGMVRRLGAKRWHWLHKLVYLTAIAAVTHYCLEGKVVAQLAKVFVVVMTVLLGYRLVMWMVDLAKPAPKASPRVKIWSGPMRVARIVQETADVRTFRLAAPDGQKLGFEHQPGQYLLLSLSIDGKKVNRTYTIASAPTSRDYCEVTVKREEMGLASRHLHDALHEGDVVSVSAPAGRFTFSADQSDSVVLIAGGVGITPLMSILRDLTDRKWKGDIYFIYSAKTPEDIIFRKELEELQKRFANLHCHITLTRANGQWSGRHGRIDAELLRQTVPELAKRPVYICGPTPMIEPTIQLLCELGTPREQIRVEEFVSARRLADGAASGAAMQAPAEEISAMADDGGPARVTFSRSGKTAPLPADKSILEVAEEAGVRINFECRSGICGTCKIRLLAGSVTMETQDALDDDDRVNHIILSCQAHSMQHVTVEA